MKQIIQSYKTGVMEIIDVPIPSCSENEVLVQTSYSLISAGTEKMLIDIAKKSIIGKAQARPDLVKQVLIKVKKEGLIPTVQKVMTKLEVPIPLGYSCSGKVLLAGRNITGIQAGDRVACAGAGFANHAEINVVPKNLIVKIPDNVTDEQAAFTTVASIALQGVRQCNPTLGEKVVVIGAGLIGLITIQLLKANGCDVLAIDLEQNKLELAKKLGADATALSHDTIAAAEAFSKGIGADAVIITAASKSERIVAEAGEISRMKGRVIMVGMAPMDIPRDIYYKKELDFRMSMSYGPGRYDPNYEIYGEDYPLSYVRWTEQRNMETVLTLIRQKRLNVDALISHRFDFNDVLKAYDVINGKTNEPYLGVVLHYDINKEHRNIPATDSNNGRESQITIGIIGAGNFAQSVLLPNVSKLNCELRTLVENNTINCHIVSKKYKIEHTASDIAGILNDEKINTVFITTPHHLHCRQIIQALQAGKHVFVEKPLAINEEELNKIDFVYKKTDKLLIVGFNRRFSNHAKSIHKTISQVTTPLVMNYIINAGPIPKSHWIQHPDLGGGRIIGEGCHFIDFMQYICDSLVVSVFATSIRTDNTNYINNDSVQITLEFANGSIGNITYHALGDSSLPKEYFEVSGGGATAKLYDFKKTEITMRGKTKRINSSIQDKGFRNEYKDFLDAVMGLKPAPINYDSMYNTTLTTFRIMESLQTGIKLPV